MGRQTRTRAELVSLLAEQRAALAASCESYDKGNEWEAARLATAIFTLLHDGGSIKALLTQLGLRGSLRFVSTGRYQPPAGMKPVWSTPALVGLRAGPDGTKFIPQFQLTSPDRPQPTLVQFPTWWAKEDIYDSAGIVLSRRRLVFALRHQDGGGHVGELTDPAYVQLKAGAGMSGNSADGSMKALQGANPTMRQVAWEVIETLKQLGKIE